VSTWIIFPDWASSVCKNRLNCVSPFVGFVLYSFPVCLAHVQQKSDYDKEDSNRNVTQKVA
jgi:hypothetical protein